ncbi:MAG: hypothetical protein QOK90_11340 [Nitrososphaeraceae archaeon]|nr:hypothetical protein [Nitrososphaeraceae archaeon]
MVVVVKCKKCGQEFPSGLVKVDEQTLKSNTFTNNTERCPTCGQRSNYSGSDYFWKL